ncbi:MAG TPA: PilN domain-containing protein [Xanthomonadales bacterium]|nr:PilN domain-containing protein [Xanthomonadales bacterium]
MATAIENSIGNLSRRLQRSQLGSFFRWWTGELKELLPARLQAGMQHARRRVVMRLEGQDLVVLVHESGTMQELDVLSTEQDTRIQQQRLADLLEERDLAEVSRDLLLPESRVLRKQVVLPAAAEANLRQALAFEMDRQTPFRADEVFFDYRIVERDREGGQLAVDLLLTLKEPVLNDIQALQPLGMAPSGVDVEIEGQALGVNLLPLDMRQRIVNSKSRANRALAIGLVVLLALVMAQSIWLRQHQISEARRAIEEVRDEAMEVQEIRNRIADAAEAAGFLRNRRAASPPTVKVLAEVTRILPDDTFLDRLLVGSDSVQMQGKSENAQQLIELVNQSLLFTDASFRGSTRLDARTQKEIFDVNAALVAGSAE